MKPSLSGPSGATALSTSPLYHHQRLAALRVAARGSLLIATALLLHVLLSRGENRAAGWGVLTALALVQWVCATVLATQSGDARRRLARLAPFACCLLLPVGLLAPRPGLVSALLLSHSAVYGGLALVFGRSLRRGREPLVTTMARRAEPALTEPMRAYTRSVTWLWALYGVAQVALSLLLLSLAPLRVWSMFVNLLDLPLLAATFVAEYGFRQWWLQGSSVISLRETLAAAGRTAPGRSWFSP